MWEQGAKTDNWSTTFRGIGIVIRIDPETSKPTTLNFYLGGKLADSVPVTCDVEQAKRISEKAVKIQIDRDAQWTQAEER